MINILLTRNYFNVKYFLIYRYLISLRISRSTYNIYPCLPTKYRMILVTSYIYVPAAYCTQYDGQASQAWRCWRWWTRDPDWRFLRFIVLSLWALFLRAGHIFCSLCKISQSNSANLPWIWVPVRTSLSENVTKNYLIKDLIS